MSYMNGETSHTGTISILPDSKGLPGEERLAFGTARLVTIAHETEAKKWLENGGASTAALHLNTGSGEPIWTLHVRDAQGRIVYSIFVNAHTMELIRSAPFLKGAW